MARLGISLYPEHSTLDKDKAYVTLAAKYGFKRIFTCLLSVEKEREEILAEFRELIDHAHSYGMEVILDVAPFVFEKLHVSYDFDIRNYTGFFSSCNILELKSYIVSFNRKHHLGMRDFEIFSFILHIAVMMERIAKGWDINNPKEQAEEKSQKLAKIIPFILHSPFLFIHFVKITLVVSRKNIMPPFFMIQIPLNCLLDARVKIIFWFPS